MDEPPDEAFFRLVTPHQNALRLHCYRMLGSSHDSDDVIQETLVRAWRAKDALKDEAAVRPWLYRIATNACLDELKRRKARPLPSDVVEPVADPTAAPLPASPEIPWLEPMPEAWLSGVTKDPGAAYELKESIALAFVAALQLLSAQQRAILLLRDVIGMPGDEAAETLGLSVSAANSALHRARAALRERTGASAASEVDEQLLGKYIRAWSALDLSALVTLLHDDITMSMPPSPTWLDGKAAAVAFLAARPFAILTKSKLQLVPAAANLQPAIVFYVAGEVHALQVLRFRDGRVIEMHHFCDRASFAAFALPTSSPST